MRFRTSRRMQSIRTTKGFASHFYASKSHTGKRRQPDLKPICAHCLKRASRAAALMESLQCAGMWVLCHHNLVLMPASGSQQSCQLLEQGWYQGKDTVHPPLCRRRGRGQCSSKRGPADQTILLCAVCCLTRGFVQTRTGRRPVPALSCSSSVGFRVHTCTHLSYGPFCHA